MQNVLIVGMGGFLGASLRYLLSGWVQRLSGQAGFPYGTITVNLIGCLLIGFLGGLAVNRGLFAGESRLFLLIGVLGGFTTFSTFGYDTLTLLRDGQLLMAITNVVIQVVVGVLTVWIGYTISSWT